MTPEQVKELILNGSLDEWLDCLDFAPEGVIDLVKELSIELPAVDTRKIQAFKEKKNVDLASAIKIRQEEKAEEEAQKMTVNTERRTQKAKEVEKPAAPTARRTSGSKYTVTKKSE